MAKKKKNRLNKLLKAQQLERLNASKEPDSSSLMTSVRVVEAAPNSQQADTNIFVKAEITRTVVSLAIVGLLLVVAVIIDRRSDIFSQFGNWLYQALRLASR